MYKIDDAVSCPMPTDLRKKRETPFVPQCPYASLEIGESFLVPFEKSASARVMTAKYKRRTPSWDYTVRRQVDGSLRIWRTA